MNFWCLLMLHLFSGVSSTIDIIAPFTLTNCSPGTEYICRNARMNMPRIINLKRAHIDHSKYCFIDVKDSMEIAVELILQVAESRTLNLSNDCIFPSDGGIYDMNMVAIFSYVSFDITRLMSYLLLNSNVIFVAITFQSMTPFQLVERVSSIYSYEASFGSGRQLSAIERLMNDVGMNYIAVLYIGEFKEDKYIVKQDCSKRPDTPFCYYISLDIHDHKACFKELFIDPSNMTRFEETTDMILSYPHLRTLTIYSHMSAFRMVESFPVFHMWEHHTNTKSKFYLVPFEKILSNKTEVRSSEMVGRRNDLRVRDVPGEHALNEILYILTEFEYTIVNGTHGRIVIIINSAPLALKLMVKQYVTVPYDIVKPFTIEMWFSISFETRQFIAKILSTNKDFVNNLLEIWKIQNYLEERSTQSMLEAQYFNPRIALEAQPYCNLTIPVRGVGSELTHGMFHEENWTNSYGWHCRKCVSETYKDSVGDSPCQPCSYPLTTDERKISCYDPFTNHYIGLGSSFGNIILMSATFCMFSILFTSLVFLKNRNTPIVKHANRPMTLLQLVSHLSLCVTSILLFVGRPTSFKCLLRPLITGLLFTVTVSVNLAKTQKLLVIFGSKRRHTHHEVKMIGMLEWIVVVFSLLLDVSLLVVSLTRGRAEVQYIYHDHTLVREMVCKNNTVLIIQLSYVLFLVLINGIQAVRSRTLPSHFKETTHVIYSSFVSILLLSGVCAVYFTQKQFVVKEAILVSATLALNALHFLLIYSYKIFIVLFRPSQNTLAAFNTKRANKINQHF